MSASKVMSLAVCKLVNGYECVGQASWLDQGAVVLEASRLSGDEQKQFQRTLNISDSTFRKLRQIGLAAQRLKPYLGRLPKKWTTGYVMATLSDYELTQLATSGELSPRMTVKTLETVLGRSLSSASKKAQRDEYCNFSVTLMNGDDADRLLTELNALGRRYDVRITHNLMHRHLVNQTSRAP